MMSGQMTLIVQQLFRCIKKKRIRIQFRVTRILFLDMKRNAREMSPTTKRNLVIPNTSAFRVISQENLYSYQEQVKIESLITSD